MIDCRARCVEEVRVSLRVAEGSETWREMADVKVVCVERFPQDANLVVERCVVVPDDPSKMHKRLVLRFYGCLVLYHAFNDAVWCVEGDVNLKLVLVTPLWRVGLELDNPNMDGVG